MIPIKINLRYKALTYYTVKDTTPLWVPRKSGLNRMNSPELTDFMEDLGIIFPTGKIGNFSSFFFWIAKIRGVRLLSEASVNMIKQNFPEVIFENY
jgi:hypothetical protein